MLGICSMYSTVFPGLTRIVYGWSIHLYGTLFLYIKSPQKERLRIFVEGQTSQFAPVNAVLSMQANVNVWHCTFVDNIATTKKVYNSLFIVQNETAPAHIVGRGLFVVLCFKKLSYPILRTRAANQVLRSKFERVGLLRTVDDDVVGGVAARTLGSSCA